MCLHNYKLAVKYNFFSSNNNRSKYKQCKKYNHIVIIIFLLKTINYIPPHFERNSIFFTKGGKKERHRSHINRRKLRSEMYLFCFYG